MTNLQGENKEQTCHKSDGNNYITNYFTNLNDATFSGFCRHHKEGYLWTHNNDADNAYCVSKDGTTILYFTSPSDRIVEMRVSQFEAKEPDASIFALPQICSDKNN